MAIGAMRRRFWDRPHVGREVEVAGTRAVRCHAVCVEGDEPAAVDDSAAGVARMRGDGGGFTTAPCNPAARPVARVSACCCWLSSPLRARNPCLARARDGTTAPRTQESGNPGSRARRSNDRACEKRQRASCAFRARCTSRAVARSPATSRKRIRKSWFARARARAILDRRVPDANSAAVGCRGLRTRGSRAGAVV